ncbi:MAG: glycosyltransferase family A protein [Patescibacteria group bacterium]|nr:glycosyltransferase family A protein [Patescibacteria group bacterium]MDD4611007.1 glycosyltransferase family A protein [Patescibacteria group bacterium]
MISIIIPIYNMADKIGNCLDSIFKQTFKDFEIIIVNDGSTDDFDKRIGSILEKFEYTQSVNVFNQENQGPPSARNKGFRESRGEYLFFCDADSVLEPSALEKLREALKNHPEASYAYPSFVWGRKLFAVDEFSVERLKAGPCIHTMSLIRREHFPKTGWDESIRKFQDWDLYLTMLEENHVGVWVNEILFTLKPGGTISSWLPSFAYKFFPWLKAVKKYNQAVEIVKKKHNL